MSGIILYIEGPHSSMPLVRRAIEGIGLTLFGAASGLEGLARAEVLYPAVILLDLDLPDIDGYEVARRLHRCTDEDLRSVSIIAFSANAIPGEAEKAIAAGCDVYMQKPIHVDQLWERVETFLMIGGM